MAVRLRASDVFINCPFDPNYKPLFNAVVFTVHKLGFVARCALGVDDAGEARVGKIQRLIEQCRYGIHDISCVELDPNTGLPRFNMPLELGLFLGCKRFGGSSQSRKTCLILDRDPYRYRTFISDISGQDVHAHGGQPERAIVEVRNWIAVASGQKRLPGGAEVAKSYVRFLNDLPQICAQAHREPDALTFVDLAEMIEIWLDSTRSRL